MSKPSSTNEHGVAMVEFAIILPLLLIMFLGVAELGRALLFSQRLTQAVEAGARYAARAHEALDPDVCAVIPEAVITNARNLVVFGQVAGGGQAVVPGLDDDEDNVDVTPLIRTVTGVGDVCVVQVSASVQYEGIFGAQFIPLLDIEQPTLWATSEERYVGE